MRPVEVTEGSRQHILHKHLDADGLRAAGLLKKLYARALEAAREQQNDNTAPQKLAGSEAVLQTTEDSEHVSQDQSYSTEAR